MSNEKERKPDGIYGHWVKQMLENGEGCLEEDIDDSGNYIQYDFGLYEDDQEETE
jgi:hypothetical protein